MAFLNRRLTAYPALVDPSRFPTFVGSAAQVRARPRTLDAGLSPLFVRSAAIFAAERTVLGH